MNIKQNPEYIYVYILTLVNVLLYTIDVLIPLTKVKVIAFFCYPLPLYNISENN